MATADVIITMISVITCSIDDEKFQVFSESLKSSIGVNFELIRIDNKVENVGICEAYNKGAAAAVYDNLIFVHEDVVFYTKGWGETFLTYLRDLPNPGIIGIAGSNYKSYAPSGWWNRFYYNRCVNIIQENKFVSLPTEHIEINSKSPVKVFVLDGVFLGMKKKVFDQLKFNTQLTGFHGYDLDISLRSSFQYNNYFVPGILLSHASEGKTNENWIESIFKLHAEHHRELPMSIDGAMHAKTEQIALYDFLTKVTDSDLSRSRKHTLIISVFHYAARRLNILPTMFTTAKAYARWTRNSINLKK